MAKTGRTLDMIDLSGRTAGRRRRARIGSWIGRTICAVIAITTAGFAVGGALKLVTDQGHQDAYDKAPYCVAQTAPTQNCVLRTMAKVDYVYASRNTGCRSGGQAVTAARTRSLTSVCQASAGPRGAM